MTNIEYAISRLLDAATALQDEARDMVQPEQCLVGLETPRDALCDVIDAIDDCITQLEEITERT